MKARDLTCLKRWIGKTVIYYVTSDFEEPQVVRITGVRSGWGLTLKGQVIGQPGRMFVGKPLSCVEYTPRLFNRLRFAFHRRDAIRRLKSANERIKKGA